jgi:hypothetical protein
MRRKKVSKKYAYKKGVFKVPTASLKLVDRMSSLVARSIKIPTKGLPRRIQAERPWGKERARETGRPIVALQKKRSKKAWKDKYLWIGAGRGFWKW